MDLLYSANLGVGGGGSKWISHFGSAIAAVLRKILKVDSVVGNKN
jgi:hypothetical protein